MTGTTSRLRSDGLCPSGSGRSGRTGTGSARVRSSSSRLDDFQVSDGTFVQLSACSRALTGGLTIPETARFGQTVLCALKEETAS